MPDNLIVQVTAPMRAELGIPRNTVVTVRRWILPLVFARLSVLSLPIGAVVFASLQVHLSALAIVVTMAVVLILSFALLRRKAPPRL